jgi:hypothetical protein
LQGQDLNLFKWRCGESNSGLSLRFIKSFYRIINLLLGFKGYTVTSIFSTSLFLSKTNKTLFVSY